MGSRPWSGKGATQGQRRTGCFLQTYFACSPGAGVRRHDLEFQFVRTGYWTAVDGRMIRRPFLPMFGIFCTQMQRERFVYNLDAFMHGLPIQ